MRDYFRDGSVLNELSQGASTNLVQWLLETLLEMGEQLSPKEITDWRLPDRLCDINWSFDLGNYRLSNEFAFSNVADDVVRCSYRNLDTCSWFHLALISVPRWQRPELLQRRLQSPFEFVFDPEVVSPEEYSEVCIKIGDLSKLRQSWQNNLLNNKTFIAIQQSPNSVEIFAFVWNETPSPTPSPTPSRDEVGDIPESGE